MIAELFLEGQPLFELSQLLAYRRGQYDPTQHLEKVDKRQSVAEIFSVSNINLTPFSIFYLFQLSSCIIMPCVKLYSLNV